MKSFYLSPIDSIPYSSSGNILEVVVGDMSYENSLALMFGDAQRLTVTTNESYKLIRKYEFGKYHLSSLITHGAKVIFEVDIEELEKDTRVNGVKYATVEINQPHAGTFGRENTHKRKTETMFDHSSKWLVT
ncbi:hypothetical protein HanHA300_Chr09g0336401 [Helianthus annuus]|nr:hypothetical protein HanHA300_Chr09g0336401 [Helianthus annuus]KAJ0544067.1 hypothetical protein HanHA89_Chr09g0357481 [Helianthus annuus]